MSDFLDVEVVRSSVVQSMVDVHRRVELATRQFNIWLKAWDSVISSV